MSGGEVRRLRLRRDGMCSCGLLVAAGQEAGWDRGLKRVVCLPCLSTTRGSADPRTTQAPATPEPAASVAPVLDAVDAGRAGASAHAEHARRSAKRAQRIRQAHPRLGGLILALSDDPQTTKAWASGGRGEERVGAKLDGLAGDAVQVLHDRRIPGSRCNIDHIAIGPSGVFVIDAKRYVNAKVEVRRSGGLFSPRTERLFVRGRDCTKFVAGLGDQVASVYEALETLPQLGEVVVQPVLAMVDADLPMFGDLEIAGVPVLGPRGTARLVRRDGPLTGEQREALHRHLAERLPAYVR